MSLARSNRRLIERKLNNAKSVTLAEAESITQTIKNRLNRIQKLKLLSELPKNIANRVEGEPFPKEYSKIRSVKVPKHSTSLAQEVDWTVSLLLKYAEKINNFIGKEYVFNRYFLLGEYAEASQLLDDIEKEISVSQWSIEKRLLLLEYQAGLYKQKEFLNQVTEQSEEPLVTVLSLFQSLRAERKLPVYKFQGSLNDYIESYDDGFVNEYMKFSMLGFSGHSINNPSRILLYNSTSSLVDRYHALIKIAFCSLCERKPSAEHAEIWRDVAHVLKDKIFDVKLSNLYNFFLAKHSFPDLRFVDTEIIRTIDLFTSGDYAVAAAKAKDLLLIHSDCFELYEIYLKSIIHQDINIEEIFSPESLASKTLLAMYGVLKKEDNIIDALSDLHKVLYSLGWSSLSCRMSSFILKELSIDSVNYNYNRFSLFNTSFISPDFSAYMVDKTASCEYLDSINSLLNDKSSVVLLDKKILYGLYESAFSSGVDDVSGIVDRYQVRFYEAEVLQAKNKLAGAFALYEDIKSESSLKYDVHVSYNYQEIISNQISCLIGLNEFTEAIKLATSALISNRNLINRFQSDNLVKFLINASGDSEDSIIEFPIYLNLYQAATNEIYIAYDNFLCSLDVKFPHQLRKYANRFSVEKLVYFLNNICKQEVLSSSYHYVNQEALDNERIEVCLLLADIDGANRKVYVEEISSITRELLIRRGIRQIDESKIYVDIKGLKKSQDKDLRETFYRYLELGAFSMEQLPRISQGESFIIPYFSTKTSKNGEEHDIKLATYSRFRVFMEMFIKIRDKFIASNESGLDTYLSTRIRHGTLVGHIRSIFEKHNMVTIKDTASEKYLSNTYWQNELGLPEYILNRLDKILSNFSEKIDLISDELKARFIQVSTEKRVTEGLFKYSYDEVDLMQLFSKRYASFEDYELFFEEVLDELWARTEKNLLAVRQFVSVIFKNLILAALKEVSDKLNVLSSKYSYYDFSKIMRSVLMCQTDIVIGLERISGWFQRTNTSSINEFDISVPLDVSMQVVRRIYPSFRNLTALVNNTSSMVFEGEFLPQFADMMQILMENIIKHSRMDEDSLNIEIILTDASNNLLSVCVENSILYTADRNENDLDNKINDLNLLFCTPTNDESIRTEKGSGYPKLKKILYNDLNSKSVSVSFSHQSGENTGSFQVCLAIDADQVMKRHNTSAL